MGLANGAGRSVAVSAALIALMITKKLPGPITTDTTTKMKRMMLQ